jgi:two-component system cell cycle response regulator
VANPDAETKQTLRPRRGAGPKRRGACCLVMIYGPRLGHRVAMAKGEHVLGRGLDSDVLVSLEDVSRRHCAIRVKPSGVFLRDLGSKNGTFLNEDELARNRDYPLRSGDLVHVGGAIFKFLEGGNVEALYHEEIYRTAIVDGLTQINNQRYFVEFLERELARCGRHAHPLALVLFDVDQFKAINDERGHVAGDHVLRGIAAAVRPTVRREACFARYGGDEFVLVLPDTALEEAMVYAEKVRGIVEACRFEFDGKPLDVTVSVGVATMKPGVDEPGSFIRAADDRLYEAKHSGRNCVRGGPSSEGRGARARGSRRRASGRASRRRDPRG